MHKLYSAGATLLAFAVPAVASAQNLGNIETLVQSIGRIIDLAIPIVASIALIAFFWGLAKYIFSAGDPEKQKEGRGIMIWGVIALFVLVSIWGIVGFISNALGISNTETDTIPTFNNGPGN